jgi:hypothetical protein
VPRCKKFHVITYAYPAGASGGIYTEKGKTFLTAMHVIEGEDRNIKRFFKDLKKDRRIKKLEVHGSKFSYIFHLKKGGEHVQAYYSPKLIFVKPVVNHFDGFEYWEIGSWDRKELMNFMNKVKKHMDFFELLKLSKSKLADVYFPVIFPKLPKKQKKAIELAFKRGYYSYPKKVELKDLAREMKISIPTMQEHLRKAEIKLIPFVLKQKP